jgi:N-acetylmuramoyl-L-alanine amidase
MTLTPADFQQLLIDHGFSCGPYGADGIWGSKTAGACSGWFDRGSDLMVEPAPPPVHGDIVPPAWMPDCDMTYITLHWTAGAYEASDHDKQYYHIIIESDGKLVRGDKPISANVSTADDNYAAHTASANTKNIGIACAAMAGAVESPFDPGKYPLTEKQWLTAAKVAAELGAKYDIAPERNRMLSHGEWQSTMGVPQSGKWDIMRLPWSPGLSGSEVNDLWRSKVKEFM